MCIKVFFLRFLFVYTVTSLGHFLFHCRNDTDFLKHRWSILCVLLLLFVGVKTKAHVWPGLNAQIDATGFFYVAPIHKCLCVFPAPNPRFFFVFPLRLIGLQSAQANNNMVSVIIKSHTDARTHARTAGGGLDGTEEEEVQGLGQDGVLKAVPVSEWLVTLYSHLHWQNS